MKKLMILFIMVMSLMFLTGTALANGDDSAEALAGSTAFVISNGTLIPIGLVPQDLKFPQLIPYFGPDNPGYRFRPLFDILLYQNQFTVGSLQEGFNGRTYEENQLTKITNPEALKEVITVIYNAPTNGKNGNVPDKGYKRMGYVGAMAVGDCTSMDAFKIMLLLANKMGAKVVHATRQGVNFSMHSTGYGIALGGVSGTLSESKASGAVASGMIGWSTGESGTNKDPWVQGVALEPLP